MPYRSGRCSARDESAGPDAAGTRRGPAVVPQDASRLAGIAGRELPAARRASLYDSRCLLSVFIEGNLLCAARALLPRDARARGAPRRDCRVEAPEPLRGGAGPGVWRAAGGCRPDGRQRRGARHRYEVASRCPQDGAHGRGARLRHRCGVSCGEPPPAHGNRRERRCRHLGVRPGRSASARFLPCAQPHHQRAVRGHARRRGGRAQRLADHGGARPWRGP